MFKNSGITKKVMLIIVIIITVLFFILLLKDNISYEKSIEKRIESIAEFKRNSFQDAILDSKEKGELFLDGVMMNREAIELFSNGKREELYEVMKKQYKEMKKDGRVEQIQFHTPPATSFLRIHKPEKYGDDLTEFRKTVVKANKEKKR